MRPPSRTDSLFIAVPLPKQTKQFILSLCYGLPCTEWAEKDNLYLLLLKIDNADGAQILDLKETLQEVFFPVFEAHLEGIGYTHHKDCTGSIWITVKDEAILQKLCNTIHRTIKDDLKPGQCRKITPCVPIASFWGLPPQKLAAFLQERAFLLSLPIENFLLLDRKETAKNVIYSEVESYPLVTP